jgi:hypothetical protein
MTTAQHIYTVCDGLVLASTGLAKVLVEKLYG